MVIYRSQYQPLKKIKLCGPKICGHILNIFGVKLKLLKLTYKINQDTCIKLHCLVRDSGMCAPLSCIGYL